MHKQFNGAAWVMNEEKAPGLTCAADCPGCKKKAPPKEEHHSKKEDKSHGKSHRR